MTTLRARLAGLTALTGLLLVVIGAPAVLIAIGATPFPEGLPTVGEAWATLRGVDDGTAILTLLRLAAWAAWAYLALGVVLELISRARGIAAPQIRGLGLSQSTAHALVSAALLTFTALPALATPATAAPGVVAAVTPSPPAPATPTGGGDPEVEPVVVDAVDAPAVALVHTVRPGETLWGIAERYLGDGARFLEIAAANYGTPQADGRTLTTTHRIHPGWQLLIPTTPDPATADVTGPAAGQVPYIVQAGDTLWGIAGGELGDPTRYGEIYTASTGITQPGGHHLSDPDEISPGWTLHLPADPSPAVEPTPGAGDAPAAAPVPVDREPVPAVDAPTGGGRDDAPPDQVRQDGDPEDVEDVDEAQEDVGGWPVRTAAGVGSLLAAGLIGLLTTRRAMQARRRRPGIALPMPTGPAAATETELRVTADRFGIAAVDTALRTLAHACSTAGQPLPVLRFARLCGGQLDLHLAQPAHLPQPWTGDAGASVWTLHVQDADLLDPDGAADIPAPYPALVTLGHDNDDGHVFVDLEQVGSLAVVGDDEPTLDVLAALAVELATSAWADDLQVTVVAAFPELEDALRTGRIRYLPSAGRLLDELAVRAEADRAALAEAGALDLQHARVRDAAPDAWYPEIVLLATPLTDRQRAQLTTILDAVPRVAVAAVTTGPGPGSWVLNLEEQDQGLLEPLGIRLRPQRLDRPTYRDILDLVSLAGTEPTQPYPTGGSREPAGLDLHPASVHEVAGSPDDDGRHAADTPEREGHFRQHAPSGAQGVTAGSTDNDRGVGSDLPAEAGQVGSQPADGSGQVAHDSPTPDPISMDSPEQSRPTVPVDTRAPVDSAHSGADLPRGSRARSGAPIEEAHAPDTGAQRPAPFIRLLGPVLVENARGKIDQSHQQRAVEFAAFLALHPGASSSALEEALWPGRPAANTRNTLSSKVRTWLGKTPDGQAYFPKYQPSARFVLHPAVRTDWDLWGDLLPDGPLPAPTEKIEAALALVRGRPFENAPSTHYTWAEADRTRMVAQIADAACELARRRAHAGDWRGAEEAALNGLAIDPSLERLWRVRILAAHATRCGRAGQDAIDRMLTIAGELGGDLEAETTALLTGIRTDTDPHLLLAVAL